MTSHNCGMGNIRKVGGICSSHPEYLKVVEELIRSGHEWRDVQELKRIAGIATRANCDDAGKWLKFSYAARTNGYIETTRGKHNSCLIRVAPNMVPELQRIVDWVRA